ncbi:MAG: hypothetical protein DLM61_19850 [Pseudonocardiales bacterium]|nr:MAG: hypothetical protein DLM61_19850 [Pseudonocardiales bacterium]
MSFNPSVAGVTGGLAGSGSHRRQPTDRNAGGSCALVTLPKLVRLRSAPEAIGAACRQGSLRTCNGSASPVWPQEAAYDRY